MSLTWLLRPFLSGVGSTDPETFLAVPAVLLAVAILAIWWPAPGGAGRPDGRDALRMIGANYPCRNGFKRIFRGL